MITVRGCTFPDHLLYDVENHIWYVSGWRMAPSAWA